MEPPVCIVNFKNYPQGTGKSAVKLAQELEEIARKSKIAVAVAVNAIDLRLVCDAVSIPVLAQHIDPIDAGAHTGAILPDLLEEAGAAGSLLNHSEKPMDFWACRDAVKALHELKLQAVVCSDKPQNAFKYYQSKPDFLAIEPPDLIGGDVSVSKAQPGVITSVTSHIKDVPILCGAGINSKEDVRAAVKLGAKGILVASHVVLARNPGQALKGLLSGF